MNLAAFAAVAIFACLPRTATAHPSLVGSSKCGEDAHPTTARSHHAAPVPDNTMSFLMYYAAEAPTDDEMVPDRTIPGEWAIDSAQYKPGARHTLVVKIPEPRRVPHHRHRGYIPRARGARRRADKLRSRHRVRRGEIQPEGEVGDDAARVDRAVDRGDGAVQGDHRER